MKIEAAWFILGFDSGLLLTIVLILVSRSHKEMNERRANSGADPQGMGKRE